MTRKRWTHAPTWPDRARIDRTVWLSESIGRVYRVEGGPMAGRWEWFYTKGGEDGSGSAETLAEALEALRQRHQRQGDTERQEP